MAGSVETAILVSGWFAAFVCWALALVVGFAGPPTRLKKTLILFLFLAGYTNVAWGAGPTRAITVVLSTVALTAITLHGVVYLRLLATLDTPLVAPLRRPRTRRLVESLLVLPLLPSLTGVLLWWRADDGRPLPYDAWMSPLLATAIAGLAFALVAAVSAYRRAEPGTAARQRAGYWALSFGIRDVLLAGGMILNAVTLVDPARTALYTAVSELFFYPGATLLSVPLLAYGILRSQLFDIDLRIKVAIERGTLAAIFLAAFFGVAVVAQQLTTAAFGLALGGVVAALLMFAIIPLHRLAGEFADRLMPGVKATDDYLATRKLEVYRAAVEEALATGSLTAEDERMLAQMRKSLSVSEEEHRVLVVALRPRAQRPPALAQYDVVRELGRGGFGRAVLARDRQLDRTVVLKQPIGLAATTGAQREHVLREARLAARVHHPNVVAIHHVLADADPPVIVMEHVDGESLADALRRGPVPADRAAAIALDVLAGLDAIHAAGIVHRDLKPANILLDPKGRAKITDFGVAHAPSRTAMRALTAPGLQPGSPAYMSPEQAEGRPLDARSDLYSLGVVLHEALTGQLPPQRRATADPRLGVVSVAVQEGPRAAPTPIEAVLRRALEPDPTKRPASAAAMAEALRGALASLPEAA